MQIAHHPIQLDLDSLLREELPYLYGLSQHHAALHQSVEELLAFPLQHTAAMPFYGVPESQIEGIHTAFSATYAALLEALQRLFQDPQALYDFMDCPFLRKHGAYFIPYARHTFNSRTLIGQSLYGRFDAVIDPNNGAVTGIYEFNGDTPVMLFESINLQHRLLSQIDPTGQSQYNEWYDLTRNLLKAHRLAPQHQIALACSFDHIEDLTTCETLAQVIGEQAAAHLLDLSDIDYDHAELRRPFVIRNTDTYLDALFVLSPWEEMVEQFPTAFMNWEQWANHVALLEPAWRWFMSHKGLLAYITELMEKDHDFAHRHRAAPLLKTYRTAEPFQRTQQAYVSKPVLGRLSANIEVFDAQGQLQVQTQGLYAQGPRIYQEYLAAAHWPKSPQHFIAGMWMAGQAGTQQAIPATLCFREFETPVLELSNERFIPHQILGADSAEASFVIKA